MRLNKILFSLTFLFILTWIGVKAQGPPVSATGHVNAEIIPVFSATETAEMNFGRFSPGPEGGQIILSPLNSVSVLGSVYSGSGTHNAASFYVSGDLDAAYSITLPKNPVVLTHLATAKTLTIVGWNTIPSPGPATGRLQNGFQIVYVGATLKVGTLNDNPVGTYTGVYTITFDFN